MIAVSNLFLLNAFSMDPFKSTVIFPQAAAANCKKQNITIQLHNQADKTDSEGKYIFYVQYKFDNVQLFQSGWN